MTQMGLFGPVDEPRGGPVGPAPVPEEVAGLAARLPGEVRLGTSSWSFPGWAGLVYDRPAAEQELARQGLGAYAAHPLLRTVGVDRTYYAPLEARTFAGYAAVVPDGFRFLVKAAEAVTTPAYPNLPRYGARRGQVNQRFLDPAWATDEVVGPALAGLGSKIGPLVFQLPPVAAGRLGGPERFADRLHAFLGALPAGPLYAVELRTPGLLTPRYAAALADAGAVHCVNAHPSMPPPAAQAATAAPALERALVARWLLRRDLDYAGAKERFAPFDRLVAEDARTREGLAHLVAAAAAAARPCFVVVNNKAEGCSPRSVARLAAAIAERTR